MKKLTRSKIAAGGWVGGHQRISQGPDYGISLKKCFCHQVYHKSNESGRKVLVTQATRRIMLKAGVPF